VGEIGQIIGLDYSTVSQGRKRLRESLKSEEVARTYGEDRGKVVKNKDLTPTWLRNRKGGSDNPPPKGKRAPALSRPPIASIFEH